MDHCFHPTSHTHTYTHAHTHTHRQYTCTCHLSLSLCRIHVLDASMKTTGFYAEQYGQHHQQHQMHSTTALPHSHAHAHYPGGTLEPITVMPMGNHDYSTALSALFEHSANFPLKAEPRQHMPPTPPGE